MRLARRQRGTGRVPMKPKWCSSSANKRPPGPGRQAFAGLTRLRSSPACGHQTSCGSPGEMACPARNHRTGQRRGMRSGGDCTAGGRCGTTFRYCVPLWRNKSPCGTVDAVQWCGGAWPGGLGASVGGDAGRVSSAIVGVPRLCVSSSEPKTRPDVGRGTAQAKHARCLQPSLPFAPDCAGLMLRASAPC